MAEYTNELRNIATNLSKIAAELKKSNDREDKRDTKRAFERMAGG